MPTGLYTSETARWNAVRSRDPQADGSFVYCVKTTKIFCRPTCSARLARQANITFLSHPVQAEAAGYRACKRCKPELEVYISETDLAIARVRRTLENLPQGAPLPKLEVLAADAGLTKFHFHRCFKKATGVTPREYALSRRRISGAELHGGNQCRESSEPGPSTPSLISDGTLSTGSMSPPESGLMDLNFEDWLVDLDDPALFCSEGVAEFWLQPTDDICL